MTARIPSITIAVLVGCTPVRAATAPLKFECIGSTGKRVQYADVAAQCPSGSIARSYPVPDACSIGMCVTGPVPPDAVPVELICCAFVSGDSDCHEINTAIDCPADEYLATCNWGQSNSDGSVTCYD
jgi:hypothetical protein